MKMIVPALILVIGAISSGFAQDTKQQLSPSHMETARTFVRILNVKEVVLRGALSSLGVTGVGREITARIMTQRINWQPLEELAARIYGEAFTEEELARLIAFLTSEVGMKMQAQQSVLMQKMTQGFGALEETTSNMFISTCAARIVGSAVERSRRMQISLGQEPPSMESVLEASTPLIVKSEKSCACMFEKAVTVSNSRDITKMFKDPKVQQAMAEAAKKGECPDPLQ